MPDVFKNRRYDRVSHDGQTLETPTAPFRLLQRKGNEMLTLTANAGYMMSGHYIARITGRNDAYTFAREFIGRKCGKRDESCEADVDSPGIYECCGVQKDGKHSRYYFVCDHNGKLCNLQCSKEEAMKVARYLDDGRDFSAVVQVIPADPEAVELRKKGDICASPPVPREERAAAVSRLLDLKAQGKHPVDTYVIVTPGQVERSIQDQIMGILSPLATNEKKSVIKSVWEQLKNQEK